MTIKLPALPPKPVEDMNIHEKRKYAKYIGVKSPTVLSLAELDEAIRVKEVEIGSLKEMIGIYDMRPDERMTLSFLVNAQSRVSRNQSGYFYPFPEGDGVLRYETFKRLYEMDIYIPKDVAEMYGLRKGDLVSGDIVTVIYNKTNIIRSIRHINDHPVKSASMRTSFANLQKASPSAQIKLASNNSIIGLMRRLLFVGEGQTVAVRADEKTSQRVAYDLIVSLYRSFDGQIFCIYDPSFEDGLKMGYNPFSCTNDTDGENIDILLERTKRLIEEGISVAVVAYTKNDKVLHALQEISGSYSGGTITAFFCLGCQYADAVITVSDGTVTVAESQNRYTLLLSGAEMFKKLLNIRASLSDDTPDALLAKVIALTN